MFIVQENIKGHKINRRGKGKIIFFTQVSKLYAHVFFKYNINNSHWAKDVGIHFIIFNLNSEIKPQISYPHFFICLDLSRKIKVCV